MSCLHIFYSGLKCTALSSAQEWHFCIPLTANPQTHPHSCSQLPIAIFRPAFKSSPASPSLLSAAASSLLGRATASAWVPESQTLRRPCHGGDDNYKPHFVILHYNPEQQKAQDWLGFLTSRTKSDRRLGECPDWERTFHCRSRILNASFLTPFHSSLGCHR